MAKLSVAVLFVTMGLLTAGISGAVSAAEPAPARETDNRRAKAVSIVFLIGFFFNIMSCFTPFLQPIQDSPASLAR